MATQPCDKSSSTNPPPGVQRRPPIYRHALRNIGWLLTALLVAGSTPGLSRPAAGEQSSGPPGLYVSSLATRQGGKPLAGKIVSNNIFVFVSTRAEVTRVRFFLDHPQELLEDPQVAGVPYAVDTEAPYDFAGTAGDTKRSARAFDARRLANGAHTITAAVDLKNGGTQVISTRFRAHHGAPILAFTQDRLALKARAGGRITRPLDLVTSDGPPAGATVKADVPWLSVSQQGGSTSATHAVTADTSGLAPGRYTGTITATAPGYGSTSMTTSLMVEATESCAPLACSEIRVRLPYELSFSQDHGKITDGVGAGTGFTYVDQPTNGSGYLAERLAASTASPGTLKITTTRGLAYTASNSQDNALAVGIDAPSQISLLKTTLRSLPVASGNYEQAGLWFGNDEENYVKVDVVSTALGTQIEYLMEHNGLITARKVTAALSLAGATLTLHLRANPSDRTIAASYQINGGASVALDEFIVPSEFFSFDAAGIDPAIGTNSFGGIFASQRAGQQSLAYTFDDFSVTREESSTPPPSGDVAFDRSSFSVPDPTAMAWGADGRLYVAEMLGKIHAISFNSAKQVTADQIITTLGSRLVLGITVDPLSTASNVILWVAHSSPSTTNGDLNSSMVTRLSGTGFATRQDVITGLPRAIANHGINAVHFGPDGKLYIALGGNTGAGAPNTANTEFGPRAEQPLSAALLVADVRATGFDGTCATAEGSFGPSPCNVAVYSSGLRNAYDFVHHSNGSIYAPDNGLGVTGTYPPMASPPCTGLGRTTAWNSGGHNPGEQPDILVRLEQGKYYGHPNPYRQECVFKDGSYQGVAPLATYVRPIHNLGLNRSADGIIEYTSDVFGGALKGELLITNYSVGDDITRIKLAADGRSVVESRQLVGGFSNPLPLVQSPDGTLYVGEHGSDTVSVLRPRPSSSGLGSWSTRQPLPTAILDAGGTALGGKLYLVAGKTSTSYQSALHIYDPATNSWTTGPNLPGPAIENPAVAALNGKLYVFGGSTAAFSGAVVNAAVFDPATSVWTALAPLRTARGGATAQALNGKLYLIGGLDGSGSSLASVEVYDPATNTWSAAPAMGTRRDNPGSAMLGGKLYVFGGRTREASGTTVNGTLSSVEMYDPATNLWTARAAMPTGRRSMAIGMLNGRAQLMGGERTSTGGTFAENEEYDPLSNSWRTLTPMLTPRHGAVAATINGVVYVAGGGPTGGSSYSTVNEALASVAP